jgi:hypothetical protein
MSALQSAAVKGLPSLLGAAAAPNQHARHERRSDEHRHVTAFENLNSRTLLEGEDKDGSPILERQLFSSPPDNKTRR